jgi:hypothetical protein
MKRFQVFLALVLEASPIVGLAAIGVAFLATPNEQTDEFRPVSLEGIGAEPKLVKLLMPRRDAWERRPDDIGGYAHVRRAAGGAVIVLSSLGPRMGDFISFEPELRCFQSECFRSRFDLDGRWFHDSNESMYRVDDMRPLSFRVVGDQLYVAAPLKLPGALEETR